jgi:hypothetical protein
MALGQYEQALARYERDIRPSVVAKSMPTLADSASFLWRVQMYRGATSAEIAPAPLPWEEVRALAAPMAEHPGFAFQVAHAAFALAACEDHAGLTMMLEHLQRSARQGDLFIRDMVVPLVQGIGDFAQGEYARAAQLLEPVCPHLVRIRGPAMPSAKCLKTRCSKPTYEAEQFAKAAAMLERRSATRRASVRDTFWLGRAQAGQGQSTQAQANFTAAAQGWCLGDATSSEMVALQRQYHA